jgi:hypothetical protein
MQPLRIRVDRIADFGQVVSLIGIDTETAELVTVHVDHRPVAVFWRAWREAGLPAPVEYDATGVLLNLDFATAAVPGSETALCGCSSESQQPEPAPAHGAGQ